MSDSRVVVVPEVSFQIVATRTFTSKAGKVFNIVDVSVPGVGNGTFFLPDGVATVTGIRLAIYKGQIGFQAY
jgi:hypothetical protein